MSKENKVKYDPKPEAITLDDSEWGNHYVDGKGKSEAIEEGEKHSFEEPGGFVK